MQKVLTFILAGSIAAGATLIAQTRSAADLFQEALAYEEVKGDLQKAITAYQAIVERFAADRPVAARAQFHLARCLERLGRSEAVAAYERVVREYSDQPGLVAQAQVRLTALDTRANARGDGGLIERQQVWAGDDVDLQGGISSDGRYISYVTMVNGKAYIAVRDLTTGQSRVLTEARGSEDGYPYHPVISPDGQFIGFVWEALSPEGDRLSINLVRFDGTGLRVLAAPPIRRSFGLAWSPDGRRLAAIIGIAGNTAQVALVSLADGTVTQLRSFRSGAPEFVSFSPDGRFLAVEVPPDGSGPDDRCDIFALAIDGRSMTPLAQGPTEDYQPAWTPDGRGMVFSSNRSGRDGLWAVRVSDGKPLGPPLEIRPNTGGRTRNLGFSRDGTLFYAVVETARDNYIASVDPETLKVTSAPRRLSDLGVGSNSAPHWSPDGRYIAFLRDAAIAIRSVADGVERVLPANVLDAPSIQSYGMSWFPDGRSLLIRDTHPSDSERAIVRRIDVETGKELVLFEAGRWDVWPPLKLSPDGLTVFYTAFARDTVRGINQLRLMKRDLATNRETELFQKETGFYSFYGLLVSPDGSRLVFLESVESGPRTLLSLPTNGGVPSALWPTDATPSPLPTSFVQHWSRSWTPDGRFVLSRTADGAWAYAVAGTPRQLDWPLPHIGELSPDGRHTVYPVTKTTREVRTIGNVLSRIPPAE